MVITNGLVFGEDCLFKMADIAFEGELITQVAPLGSLAGKGAIDAGGGYVLPGFVDIHTHGAVGGDFCDGDAESIEKMLEYYGECGITSILGTLISSDKDSMSGAITAAADYFGKDGHGAVLRGVHMEGPFINPEKSGSHDLSSVIPPSKELFDEMYTLADGYIKLVGVAPELYGAVEFIRHVAHRCVVALAHTDATYKQALAAFDAGAGHVTHLFNAMSAFGHRSPGVVGAASDKDAFVELISDGIHLHPSVVRSAFKWFGEERVCLVSDSMRACGMPNGHYMLGTQRVWVQEDTAVCEDTDVIAASVLSLAECCRRAIGFGVPIEQAVRAATLNPATAVGLQSSIGSLMPGKRADIVIWNRSLQTDEVIVGGKCLLG